MEMIFLSVLNMSLTASFVIVAICLARLPLKKAPKIISYALWAVAGFRLVFPFTLESVFSLLPFKSTPIPQDIATQAVPRIDSGIAVIDNAVSAALPAAAPAASVNPLQVWIAIGSYIWLFGVVVMLIYSFVSIVMLKRRLRGAALIEGNLYEADNLKTPFVIGLFSPKIFIPAGLTREERRYILLHEQTHIRRHDHVVKMVAYLVLCLHWFNPLAWIAFILMGADMEMSCDERVMRELGGDIKNAYSLSLVRVAAGHKILNGSPLAFGEGGMKERVKNVLNFKKTSRIIIVMAVVLVAVLSVGFAANKPQSGTPDGVIPVVIGQDDAVYLDEGNIHFIFIDGANKEDAPTVSVTPGSIAIVLVDKNGYWTFSPYKDISALSANIKEECIEMINRKENNGFSETHMEHIMKRVDSLVGSTAAKINIDSILGSYYTAQNSSAFEMFNKKIFVNLADDWTAEIGDIENPVWNYDSFAQYYVLDHNMLSASRYEELYYCTFSADNDKFGYTVVSYDGSNLQKISVVETLYLYDLKENIGEIIDGLSETGIDLSSVVASRVKWVDTSKNRSDEVILFTDNGGNNYICYLGVSSFELEKLS